MITTMNPPQDPKTLAPGQAADFPQKLRASGGHGRRSRASSDTLINAVLTATNKKETFTTPTSVAKVSTKQPGIDEIKNLLGDLGISSRHLATEQKPCIATSKAPLALAPSRILTAEEQEVGEVEAIHEEKWDVPVASVTEEVSFGGHGGDPKEGAEKRRKRHIPRKLGSTGGAPASIRKTKGLMRKTKSYDGNRRDMDLSNSSKGRKGRKKLGTVIQEETKQGADTGESRSSGANWSGILDNVSIDTKAMTIDSSKDAKKRQSDCEWGASIDEDKPDEEHMDVSGKSAKSNGSQERSGRTKAGASTDISGSSRRKGRLTRGSRARNSNPENSPRASTLARKKSSSLRGSDNSAQTELRGFSSKRDHMSESTKEASSSRRNTVRERRIGRSTSAVSPRRSESVQGHRRLGRAVSSGLSPARSPRRTLEQSAPRSPHRASDFTPPPPTFSRGTSERGPRTSKDASERSSERRSMSISDRRQRRRDQRRKRSPQGTPASNAHPEEAPGSKPVMGKSRRQHRHGRDVLHDQLARTVENIPTLGAFPDDDNEEEADQKAPMKRSQRNTTPKKSESARKSKKKPAPKDEGWTRSMMPTMIMGAPKPKASEGSTESRISGGSKNTFDMMNMFKPNTGLMDLSGGKAGASRRASRKLPFMGPAMKAPSMTAVDDLASEEFL